MIPAIRYTMLLAGVLVTAPGGMSTVHADSVVVYPVQSGLIDAGSCCGPYPYTNSSSSTFLLTGCFNSTYGCGYQRERAAWRWDLGGQVPEGAEVTNAYIRWDQPSSCFASYVDVYIDANTQVLSSSYCAQMRGSSDQTYYDQSYWASTVSWMINPQVIEEALSGGYLCMQTDNDTGADGCAIYNSGPNGARVIINYNYPQETGACCMASGNCVVINQSVCENAGFVFLGEGVECASDSCSTCDGDYDDSGGVDTDDLLSLLTVFGTADTDHDLDEDGFISVNDVLIFLSQYGECV